MTHRPILIRGGHVVVGSPREGNVQLVDILIKDSVIREIAPRIDASDAEVIDASDSIVIPGFVDTHNHLWEAALRGITRDWSGIDFGWGMRYNHAPILSPDDIYSGTLAAAVSSLDAGFTTTIDHLHAVNSPEHARAGLRAARESGIRTLWCYGLTDANPPVPVFGGAADRRDDLRTLRTEEFAGSKDTDRVVLGMATNDIGGVPWETIREEYLLARELDLTITTHTDGVFEPGRRPEIELLHADGLLGPRQVHSHANAITDAELRLLADVGAGLSSTPEAELQMGMGFPVFAQADRLGVNVGLGTDDQGNNSADPFMTMRVALHAENGRTFQPILEEAGFGALPDRPVTTLDALYFATLGGARAMGMGGIVGSLDIGKQADVLIVSLVGVHQRPVVNPLSTLLMHSRPSDIRTVLVGGEIVKQSGTILGGLAERATRAVDSAWDSLSQQIEARGGHLPPRPPELMQQLQSAPTAAVNTGAWKE
ncbi:amidohydrolase family protein [Rhodococcus sp. USK13]|uniref:amidohydrolase family protein n=1 Tax=Rhodococcus sp. USK13 TaxID=2806442 RepID=UPI001BCE136E|nr:amidohydrolase family protein [Rhodococcus sp. USK13]